MWTFSENLHEFLTDFQLLIKKIDYGFLSIE
jgi:hypothetical protein